MDSNSYYIIFVKKKKLISEKIIEKNLKIKSICEKNKNIKQFGVIILV